MLITMQSSIGLQAFADETKPMKIHFDHGTTTLAFKFDGGVMVATDSRATAGMWIGMNVYNF